MDNHKVNIFVINDYNKLFLIAKDYLDYNEYLICNEKEYIKSLEESLKKEEIEYEIKNFNEDKVKIDDFEEYIKKAVDDNNVDANSDSVIFALNSDRYLINLALYHAKLSASKIILVNDKESILDLLRKNKYRFVVFMFEKKDVNIEFLLEVEKIKNNKDKIDDSFVYGVLTAKNQYILNALIIKNDIFKRNSLNDYVNIIRTDYLSEEVQHNGNITEYSFHTANTDKIEEAICGKPLNVLSIIGHGRDDVIWLSDGCICGKSKYNFDKTEKDESKKHCRPACSYVDECFKKGGKIINSYNVNARHLFVNSCKGSKIEKSVFLEKYNTVFSFFEGHAISHMGCNSTIRGQEVSNFYYVAQLRAGIPLGVICENINKMYRSQGLALTEMFFLLGDPQFTNYTKGEKVEFSIDESNLHSGKNEYKFEIDKDTELISIKIPIKELEENFYNLDTRIMAYINNKKVYCSFRTCKGENILDIFSNSTISKGTLTLIIINDSKFKVDYLYNLTNFLDIDLGDNKIKLLLNESKDVTLKLMSKYKFYMNRLDRIYKDIYTKINKMEKRYMVISEKLIDFLIEKTHYKGFSWEDHISLNGVGCDGYDLNSLHVCSNCGRQLHRAYYSHIYNKKIKRVQYQCPICGFAKSFPEVNIDVTFISECTTKINQECVQKVSIVNNTEGFVNGYAGMAIVSGKEINVEYEDNKQYIELNPKEEKNISFKLKFNEGVSPHVYWLKIYFIINGEIYILKRDIWVGM